jgi:hypothetical protein
MKTAQTITTEQEIPFRLIPRTASGHVGAVFGDPTITVETGDWKIIEDPDSADPLAFVAVSPDEPGESQVKIGIAVKPDGKEVVETTLVFSSELPVTATLEVVFGEPRSKRVLPQ